MDIEVELPEGHRTVSVPDDANIFALLSKLGLYPDAVLIFRDGRVLPEDETLENGDSIRIMKIASGG
jgi:sulfur carrier protein ThiS